MASSPADPASRATLGTVGPVEFALQECTICWEQACDALTNGDFERVTGLLDVADDHLQTIHDSGTQVVDARLYAAATAARSRLEHAMRSGLDGLHEALSRARQGGKVLQGYNNLGQQVGGKVTSRA